MSELVTHRGMSLNPNMGDRKLCVQLTVLWEAARAAAMRMRLLSGRASEVCPRARLLVLASFCDAQAMRIQERMFYMRVHLLALPSAHFNMGKDFALELRREAKLAWAMEERHAQAMELARQHGDFSVVSVCRLNREEEAGRARELAALADGTYDAAT